MSRGVVNRNTLRVLISVASWRRPTNTAFLPTLQSWRTTSEGEGGGLLSPVVPPDAEVLGREEARVECDLVRVRVRVRVRG